MFQLTTSRRGRPLYSQYNPIAIYVSTHDLTKRSTADDLVLLRNVVFQLTTSRRGRQCGICKIFLWNCFNSRPHEEVDNVRHERKSLCIMFQLTTSRRGRQQFLRKKFSFQNHFLCSLHIIYSYYINTIFFSTLFLAKSSFFLVRIL